LYKEIQLNFESARSILDKVIMTINNNNNQTFQHAQLTNTSRGGAWWPDPESYIDENKTVFNCRLKAPSVKSGSQSSVAESSRTQGPTS